MNVIEQTFHNSKKYFDTHETKDIKFRRKQLKLLSKSIRNHEDELLDAFQKDLGKNKVETYASEIGFTLKNIKTAIGRNQSKSTPLSLCFQPKVIL